MPSLRMRLLNPFVRLIVKRRDWGGDDFALAQRSRRIFGAMRISQWLASKELTVSNINENGVRGELLTPKNLKSEAVIFYIHGGGFVSCSPATHRPIAAALSKTANLRVFSVEYRLAPENRFPAGLDDVCAAFSWLTEMVSPRQIAVAGDSAGGGL